MDDERKEIFDEAVKTEKESDKYIKKQKGRRAYLSDFTANVNGEYVFMGDSYNVVGANSERCRKVLFIMSLVIAVVTIALASVPYEASIKCFYVVLPLAVQCIFVIRLAWIVGRMAMNKGPLRSYIYKKTVQKYNMTSWIVLTAAIVTFLCWFIYTVINGFGESIIASLGFALLEILNITLVVAFKNFNNKTSWDLV